MNLTFLPMSQAHAHAMLSWRYAAPYDLYNPDPDHLEQDAQGLLDPEYNYYAMTDERGEFVAYCCFGPDARVPGGDYEAAALDVGMGLRPDLTGRGSGITYLSAVLDFGRRAFGPVAFRATIAEFNKRALHLCEAAGFRPVQTFRRERDGRAFVVLMLET